MSEALRVGVLGAGSWGTALAHLLGTSGHRVTLWALEPEVVAGINARHRNPLFLTEAELPEMVRATGELSEAVHGAELLLFVIPSQHVRGYLRHAREVLPAGVPLVICSK